MKLSARRLSLLRTLELLNAEFVGYPCKRTVIWFDDVRGSRTPTRTVSRRYEMLGEMIMDGYIDNHSSGAVYALMITDKGLEVLR